jgi:phosphoglycolate phosphatase
MDHVTFIVFDLDGTLIDSRQDLAASVNFVRQSLNLEPLDFEEIRPAIGHGARSLVAQCLPLALRGRVDDWMPRFHEHYSTQCVKSTSFYPGVISTLDALAEFPMAVLTNKPAKPARKILDALGAADRFKMIVGGDSMPTKKPDPEGLWAIIEGCQQSRDRTLMVGDGVPDVQAAQRAGVRSAAILDGIGDPDEVLAAGPDYSLKTFSKLVDLVIRLKGGQIPAH